MNTLKVRALTMGCPAYFRLYSFEARAMEYKAQVKETDLIWSQICSSLRHILRMHARSVASVVSDSVGPHGLWPTRLLCPWDSPGKNTGVGCHFLLQGNLPYPGIKPRSPALQADSLPTELQRKPYMQSTSC